jgi:hypothetical protein
MEAALRITLDALAKSKRDQDRSEIFSGARRELRSVRGGDPQQRDYFNDLRLPLTLLRKTSSMTSVVPL